MPAIVTPEEWALARKSLQENNKRAKRNQKREDWLLTRLARCACCGYSLNSVMGGTKRSPYRYYACVSKHNITARARQVACLDVTYMRADLVEPAVWQKVLEMIMDPELIIDSLGEEHAQKLAALRQQEEFLRSSLAKLESEFACWNRAYATGMIELEELRDYRSDIQRHQEVLRIEQDEIRARIDHLEGLDDKDNFVRDMMRLFRQALAQVGDEPTPELKRRILTMLVDNVWINHRTKMIKIEGAISSEINLEAFGVAGEDGAKGGKREVMVTTIVEGLSQR